MDKPTLFHYVHCPYCVRVRMALGHLKVDYLSTVLPYDDEHTPKSLTGIKMLPIIKIDSQISNESLDIINLIDKKNTLKTREMISTADFKEFEAYLNFLGNPIHSLAMPYWIWTPEFNEQSRNYFQTKKEAKRGPFKDLVKHQNQFKAILENEWSKLTSELKPFYKSDTFTLLDILLASHLWGLYIVPEFQFPVVIHDYLQKVKSICNFNYHQDFWI
jgi:glutaredoxin 2